MRLKALRKIRFAWLGAVSGQAWRWALYDWANSAFALIVMTSFVPLLLREHWTGGEASTEITFLWGAANSVAALLLAVAAPILGALADHGGDRRRFLAICIASGAICTLLLALPGSGGWLWGLALFVMAWLGYSAANVFYDALLRTGLGAVWRRLGNTLREARRHRQLWLFLLAYFLYIDGVHTIIKMAVDFGAAINLPPSHLVLAILVTNYLGFPATLAFGFAGRRFGPRRCIYVALAIYCVVTFLASMASQTWHFYLLAAMIGLAQGGVQSLSRSLFARLAPPEKTAEMFGFYNMFGRFAAILGPILVGYTSLVLDSQRLGVLAILVLLIAGFALLTRIEQTR